LADRVRENSAGPPPDGSCGTQILQGRFDDFEQFREAVDGWDLDWRQLDAGPLTAKVLQILSGSAFMSWFQFSRKFEQRGNSPPGFRTFGLLENGVAAVHWCGRNVTDRDILCFPSSGGYHSLSQPGFAGHTLSFPEDRLVKIAETLGVAAALEGLGSGPQPVRTSGTAADAIRLKLHRIHSEANARPSSIDSKGLRHELEFEIPAALLSMLAPDQRDSVRRSTLRARTQGLRRAMAFIDAHAHQAVTVQEVCRAAGVSWRTLDYAFREYFDMTPKQYLRAVRLNAVRRELRQAGPSARIADVANRWGFWHMGQFAADYRGLFGKLPSQSFRG